MPYCYQSLKLLIVPSSTLHRNLVAIQPGRWRAAYQGRRSIVRYNTVRSSITSSLSLQSVDNICDGLPCPSDRRLEEQPVLLLRAPIHTPCQRVEVRPAPGPRLRLWRDRGQHSSCRQWEVPSDDQRAGRVNVGVALGRERGPLPDDAGRASLSSAGRPDGGEEDAENGDVRVDAEDVRALDEVGVAEDEDELGDVEDDGEDEVGERDPEERPDARRVGSS